MSPGSAQGLDLGNHKQTSLFQLKDGLGEHSRELRQLMVSVGKKSICILCNAVRNA